jgi:hypothetical protein
MNPNPSLGCVMQPRERIERQLLRRSECDLEHEGDTGHRVERVVPGLRRDAVSRGPDPFPTGMGVAPGRELEREPE